MRNLGIVLIGLALAPALCALDVETLDGKSYKNCTVGKVEPDALCLLFPGGGARVKFVNLPEKLRVLYGYDAAKAAEYEKAQALKKLRDDAWWRQARAQAEARRQAAASALAAARRTNQIEQAAPEPRRQPEAYGGYNQRQGGYGGYGSAGGYGQGSGYGSGSEYVGVNLANGGNFYGMQGVQSYGGGYQGGYGAGMGSVYYGVRLAPLQGGAYGGGRGQYGGGGRGY